MKAAVFEVPGGPEVVHVAEVDTPDPGPGEVRVRVYAAALNHLDLWVRRGLPFAIPMPHIGGSDVAGVIDACGDGVTGIPLGTRVVIDPSLNYGWYLGESSGPSIEEGRFGILGEHTQGGLAEYCLAPAANVLEVPEHVAFETAAASALTFVTAWHALMGRAGLRPGERVLVTGASGGVSTAAIQIAKLAGATVYAVTGGAENVSRVRELGADFVYDRLAGDVGKELWGDTGKQGVHVALDSVGEASWALCLGSLAVGGRLVTYGGTTGASVESDVRAIFWKQLSILGSTMGSPAEFRRVMRLVFAGKLTPVIHEVMPLEDARRAHELLETGAVFGKLVVKP
jgi:NADPH:quinone reductase-like Zn-dependent oxidoreductase